MHSLPCLLRVGEIEVEQWLDVVDLPTPTLMTAAVVVPRHARLELRFEMRDEFGDRTAQVTHSADTTIAPNELPEATAEDVR